MSLSALGWTPALAATFAPHHAAGLFPARVALQHKHAYELLSDVDDLTAECTGKLLHAASPADLPAVGDWVAIRPRPGENHADIHAVLPRRTTFSRRAAGSAAIEQIVATNVDTVFLVTALDQNFNLRRIERYLAVASQSGAQPVVLLNKADVHADPAAAVAEVTAIAGRAPVLALSAVAGGHTALAVLSPWLIPGQTLAFLGSSGVGKSTLINVLLGDARQRTAPISDSVNKGRHTTTHRELIVAPGGFLLLDTPGMRELQLWDTPAAALDATFADVADLARRCRFPDCSHRAEPGCAIQAALADGALDYERWQSFQKLQREQAYAARRSDPRLARETKATWKKIHRDHRAATRMKSELEAD